MKLQLYGTKLATTQTFLNGKRLPVTVVLVKPQSIVGLRNEEKDGYTAYIVSAGDTKKQLHEIRIDKPELEIGHEFNLSEVLTPDTIVQIAGTSKGKGTSGVVKRWNFAGGPKTHGQSDRTRAPGSIGRGTTPGRVLRGKHMAGRMGNETITVRNLSIISFDPETSRLNVKGVVPGRLKGPLHLTITSK
jgi:large subunit ribosomal protein L3